MEQKPNHPANQFPEPPKELTEEELEQLRDMRWAATDPEVTKKYPDEIVAVYRRQIIAHGDHLNTVLEEASRITGRPKHKIAVTTILGPKLLFSPR
jgi:hypothetical protein